MYCYKDERDVRAGSYIAGHWEGAPTKPVDPRYLGSDRGRTWVEGYYLPVCHPECAEMARIVAEEERVTGRRIRSKKEV